MIADLLYDGRHPETLEKIGDGIDHIKVGRVSHNTRCFWIVRTDGSEVDFSVSTAMSGQPSPKACVSAALREEINGQISAYRRDQPETVRCALCNSPTIREEAFVTYLDPTFDEMATQFVNNHGGWEALSEKAVGPFGRQLVDRDAASDWRVYHHTRARLSLTHPQCNRTRPRIR